MLSSIHPLGEEGRGNRYRVTASAFIIGSTIGGALTGLVIGVVGVSSAEVASLVGGWLSEEWTPVSASLARLLVLGVVLTLLALMKALGRPLPGLARQVNENWLVEFRGWVYGVGFGLQLGAGVTTYVRSAAVVAWLVAIAVVGSFGGWSVALAMAIGVVFGLVRGLSILLTRDVRSPEQLIVFHRQLHGAAL